MHKNINDMGVVMSIILKYTCLADISINHYKDGHGVNPKYTNIINATDCSIGKELQVIKKGKRLTSCSKKRAFSCPLDQKSMA